MKKRIALLSLFLIARGLAFDVFELKSEALSSEIARLQDVEIRPDGVVCALVQDYDYADDSSGAFGDLVIVTDNGKFSPVARDIYPDGNVGPLFHDTLLVSGGGTMWTLYRAWNPVTSLFVTTLRQVYPTLGEPIIFDESALISELVVDHSGRPSIFYFIGNTVKVATLTNLTTGGFRKRDLASGFSGFPTDLEVRLGDGSYHCGLYLTSQDQTPPSADPAEKALEVKYLSGAFAGASFIAATINETLLAQDYTAPGGSFNPRIALTIDDDEIPCAAFGNITTSETVFAYRTPAGWQTRKLLNDESRALKLEARSDGSLVFLGNSGLDPKLREATSRTNPFNPTADYPGILNGQPDLFVSITNEGYPVLVHEGTRFDDSIYFQLPRDIVDNDGDGQSFLLEEALGTSDDNRASLNVPEFSIISIGGERFAALNFLRRNGTTTSTNPHNDNGFRYAIERSTDLNEWLTDEIDIESFAISGRGVIVIGQSALSVSEEEQQLFRLRVERL